MFLVIQGQSCYSCNVDIHEVSLTGNNKDDTQDEVLDRDEIQAEHHTRRISIYDHSPHIEEFVLFHDDYGEQVHFFTLR